MKKHIKRFRARSVSAIVAIAFAANAWAVDPFTVRDIRVEGLQRVEPGTIFASLPFRIGPLRRPKERGWRSGRKRWLWRARHRRMRPCCSPFLDFSPPAETPSRLCCCGTAWSIEVSFMRGTSTRRRD